MNDELPGMFWCLICEEHIPDVFHASHMARHGQPTISSETRWIEVVMFLASAALVGAVAGFGYLALT